MATTSYVWVLKVTKTQNGTPVILGALQEQHIHKNKIVAQATVVAKPLGLVEVSTTIMAGSYRIENHRGLM